jgi:hypothetical protein
MKKMMKIVLAVAFLAGATFSGISSVQIASAAPIVKEQSNQHREGKAHKYWLHKSMQLAATGKVINSEFGLGTDKETILRAWGTPDEEDEFSFLEYNDRGILFCLDAWSQTVNLIVTYDQRLQQNTLSEVRKVLGRPIDEYDTEGVHLLYYRAGEHEVWIGFSIPSVGNPDPLLLSLSVL